MTDLLLIKEKIKQFLGKYEIYLKPLGKFLLAFISISMINSALGYMERITALPVVLVVALMCSFMPNNFTLFAAGLFTVLHIYYLSLECALVVGVVFVLMGLLYLRFSPKSSLVLLILPICFVLKIPYVVPICVGLLYAPVSAFAVACGSVVYCVISYVSKKATELGMLESEELTSRFRYVVDGLIGNRVMILYMVAFSITVILVYVIRRLSINYAWTIAIGAGAVVQMITLLIGDMILDTGISIVGIFLGNILAAAVAIVVQFFFFHLDYNRAEQVQFEDNEYYYYVKAIPKITVSKTSKSVKKINSQSEKKVRQVNGTDS